MSEKNEKKKEKSVLDIAREMEQLRQQEEEQARELARQAEEERRIAYEKQLREERLELMRLKQGVISESETIREEKEEKRKYTIGEKIGNFFYHNKWWLGIGTFFAALTGFLVYQTVTMVHPDLIIMLIADDPLFSALCTEEIADLFEQYIEDENGDGKVTVDVYYIPASEASAKASGLTGDTAKLFAEFQLGDTLLVISDSEADTFIEPEDTLENLEPFFGEYAQTEDMRFYLSDTAFPEAVGWTDPLDADFYIGIRAVKDTFDFKEEMQKNYDIAFPALQKFVEQFGTAAEESAE